MLLAAAATVGTSAAGAQVPAPVIVRRDTQVVLRAAGVRLDSLKLLLHSLQQAEFGSDEWLALSHRLDSLVGGVMIRGVVPARAGMVRGWLGFELQGPKQMALSDAGQHVMYLAYPSIISVEPESPAGRAGITPGDVLLSYNGTDVVGHDFNVTDLFVPEHKIDVRVRREGEPHEYTLTVAKAPARVTVGMMPPMPPMPSVFPKSVLRMPMLPGNVFIIARDGVLGATMSTVGPELARALKLGDTGVLVNQVAENSPVALAGIRAGDLVVRVDSKAVATLEEMRAVVQANMDRHALAMRIVRDHKPREVTVKW